MIPWEQKQTGLITSSASNECSCWFALKEAKFPSAWAIWWLSTGVCVRACVRVSEWLLTPTHSPLFWVDHTLELRSPVPDLSDSPLPAFYNKTSLCCILTCVCVTWLWNLIPRLNKWINPAGPADQRGLGQHNEARLPAAFQYAVSKYAVTLGCPAWSQSARGRRWLYMQKSVWGPHGRGHYWFNMIRISFMTVRWYKTWGPAGKILPPWIRTCIKHCRVARLSRGNGNTSTY